MSYHLINAQKRDALEFVEELEGGWDCLFWDYPYIDEKGQFFSKGKSTMNNWDISGKEFRYIIDRDYLDQLKKLIINKMVDSYSIIEFNKVWLDKQYNIIWYKGKEYGSLGGHIRNNNSFIGIDMIKCKPAINSPLKFVEEFQIGKHNNQHTSGNYLSMSIPKGLLEKLFKSTNSSYIIDPFAGSYNSAKVCKKLNIKIDTCDKYLNPPSILRKDLFHYLD